MDIDVKSFETQIIITQFALLVAIGGWFLRTILKRFDKIDDKLDPIKERVLLTERDMINLREKHDKLEREHTEVHEKIFLKLDNHEKLISEISSHKK